MNIINIIIYNINQSINIYGYNIEITLMAMNIPGVQSAAGVGPGGAAVFITVRRKN